MNNRNLERQNKALNEQLARSDRQLTRSTEQLASALERIGETHNYARDTRSQLQEQQEVNLELERNAYWKDRRIEVLENALEVLGRCWEVGLDFLESMNLVGRFRIMLRARRGF